jgi:hypothetical protein
LRKKLWALNLLLALGIFLAGREIESRWKAFRHRERAVLNKRVPAVAAAAVKPAPAPQPVQAAGYFDVAQNMLFSKDRNPNVAMETPPAKPVPPFPRFFGVMNLGDGLMAILSEAPGRQRPYHAGDKAGEFKLIEIGAETLVFEWDQKKFTKRFSELTDRTEPAGADTTPRAAAAAPAPPKPAEPAKPGPGADMGGGMAACNPNDPSPAGTVVDGKRKVVSESPFGKVCRWEPVR